MKKKTRALVGVWLALLAGLGCLAFAKRLSLWSFDLPVALRPARPVNELIVVHMDERSRHQLGQSSDRPWDRHLHARLLELLARHGARLVVFDILFDQPHNPEADRHLAAAMKAHGNVVLAGDALPFDRPAGLVGVRKLRPTEPLLSAASGWGSAGISVDADGVARRLPGVGTGLGALSLAEAAARAAGSSGVEPGSQRYLNYYGPAGSLPGISYSLVFEQAPNVFSNKVVFIGDDLPVGSGGSAGWGQFPTPYSRWTGEQVPGVELEATAMLNLLRGEWLREMPLGMLILVLGGSALVFGVVLVLLRPWPATLAALIGMVLAAGVGFWVVWQFLVWFPWMIVCVVQIPAALIWSIWSRRRVSVGQPVPINPGSSTLAFPA